MTTRARNASILLLAAAALACARSEGPADAGAGEAPGEPVAEINGQSISSAELDAWIKEDLFRREFTSKRGSELFELRMRALDELLLERAIADEAKQREISEDALIDEEVAALGPVGDADVQEFYDRHSSRFRGATLEQMQDRIRSFLESDRKSKARERVRDRARVVVHLQPPRASVAAEGASQGPVEAPVTIVEFTDYQCPFCQRAEPTIREVVQRYPQQVRWVVRHLPLDSIHPLARGAAHAAVCADRQGRFWEFHEKLFANQQALEPAQLAGYAKELGLDAAAFDACLGSPETHARVEQDVEAAREVGVSGTPAFFVNGILLTGAKPVEEFVRVIERELEAKKS
jgi:protein-disulfide isomerase